MYVRTHTDRRTEKTTDGSVEQNSHVLCLRAVTSRLAPAAMSTVGSDLPMQQSHVIHVILVYVYCVIYRAGLRHRGPHAKGSFGPSPFLPSPALPSVPLPFSSLPSFPLPYLSRFLPSPPLEVGPKYS